MQKFWMALIPVAVFLAGCQAPTPLAPPADALASDAPKVLPPEAKRRLLAAGPSVAKLWGLHFINASATTEYIGDYRYTQDAMNTAAAMGGRIIVPQDRGHIAVVKDTGYRADFKFVGEGGPTAVKHLDQARFSYVVPEGRVLVINRVEFPERTAINEFPLGLGGWNRTNQMDAVDFYFGPGELVMFAFPYNPNGCACPASIAGMTVDPAVLGGALPGAGLDGEAK